MKIEYPKWLYHRELPARIVADRAAREALGEGWEETAAGFAAEPVAEHKKPRRAKKAE